VIDLIIDFSDVCWGVVGEVDKNSIAIPANEWAPGIWAGTKNGWIQIIDPETKIPRGIYLIISVDLENRKIEINNLARNIKPGDLIYPKVL
jgi:hypothetical protein